MPAPAPSFWFLMMSVSITMNSSSCRGLQRLLKGFRQYVFPSTSATSELEIIYVFITDSSTLIRLVIRAFSQKCGHKLFCTIIFTWQLNNLKNYINHMHLIHWHFTDSFSRNESLLFPETQTSTYPIWVLQIIWIWFICQCVFLSVHIPNKPDRTMCFCLYCK